MKSVLLCLIAATVLAAQQPNSVEASLRVNGIDGGSYPIRAVVPVGQTVNATFGGASGQPFLVVTGSLLQPGFSIGSPGLVDLAVPTLNVVADGFNPVTALDGMANIPSGSNTRVLQPFAATSQMDFAMQALMADPTSPSGLRLTAATRLRALQGNATRLVFASDDDTILYALTGGPISVAGNAQTQIWINSNGSVSFGAGDPSGDPTDAAMLAGPERLALNWRDLDPTAGGEVWVFEEAGVVTVEYQGVPKYGAAEPAAVLSGYVRFQPSGDVEMEIFGGCVGEAIVGYSSGQMTSGDDPTDLTARVPVSMAGASAAYEHFGQAAVQDLSGAVIHLTTPAGGGAYSLDITGIEPAITELFPPRGPNIGLASLILKGRGLRLGTQVLFNQTPALIVDHLSNEELLLRTPPGTMGLADLTIQVPGETPITLVDAYLYEPLQTTNIAIPFAQGQSVELPFLHGYVFPFHSRWYSSIWLNANGTLTFGSADATPNPTVSAFESGPPRIALAWSNWQWGPTSSLAMSMTPYFLRIGFVNVSSASSSTPVTLTINLSHHGEVFYTFTDPLPVGDVCLVGQTPGGAISPVNGALDINGGALVTAPFASSYEIFDAFNLFDLMGLDWNLVPSTPVGPAFLLSTALSQP
jgi:hypothetical protein